MNRKGLVGFAKFGFVVFVLSIFIFLFASYISYVTADPDSITLNSPENNTFTNDTKPDFNFTVIGGNSSYSAELFINGVGNGTNTTTLNDTATNITANTTALPDGVYTWYINATNGTTLQSEVRTITIDTVNPAVTNFIANDTVVRSSAILQINATINDTNRNDSAVSVANTSSLAMSLLSGDVFSVTTNTSDLGCTSDGACVLTVTATDNASNTNNTVTLTLTIDETNPSNFSIVSPTLANNSFTKVNYVEVNFTFTEANPDTCLLEFNNGTAVNYTMTLNSAGSWCFFNATNQSDGAFNYSIYLNDTAGNLVSNRTYFVSVDTTPPTITSFTLSSTSVTAGQTITGSCSATDNSESFGGSVTTSITGIDTTTAGSKTSTCTATDSAGNSVSSSISYTVNARIIGGGGTPPPPPLPSVSKVFDEIIPGQVAKVTITKEEFALTEIRIEVNNPVNNVLIKVTKLEGQPAEITQNITGEVLKYLNIDKTNLDNENIDKLTIDFKVEKTWISDNNIDKSTIALNRFTTQWDKLPTTLVNENEEFVFYTAESPGFSTFAISGEEVAEIPPAEPVCGNGVCESGEDSSSCPEDCPVTEFCSPGEKRCEGNYLLECNSEGTELVTLRTCTYGCDPATTSCRAAPAPTPDNTGLIIGIIVVIIIILAILIGISYKKKK